ncbi:hypothetical protein Syun_017932 [Stephania yunnanensis]|uniref:Uncharacterized protein n=1 Tax=Stephania yunnanensis TaxID=152371 RepID=A0AAP0ISE2_9MAGN
MQKNGSGGRGIKTPCSVLLFLGFFAFSACIAAEFKRAKGELCVGCNYIGWGDKHEQEATLQRRVAKGGMLRGEGRGLPWGFSPPPLHCLLLDCFHLLHPFAQQRRRGHLRSRPRNKATCPPQKKLNVYIALALALALSLQLIQHG